MPAPIPTLNTAWRQTSSKDDRELIRSYANWPVSNYNLTLITNAMNRAADASAASVAQVQKWIDEAEDLESNWADQVENGTAHLGNVESYEGVTPGSTLTRQDRQTKADVLEWDSSLHKVRYVTGSRADSTAGGVLSQRIKLLRGKVLQALGLDANISSGYSSVLRS